MKRDPRIFCFLVFSLAASIGCSSKPPADHSQKAATALDKIQGKAQTLEEGGGAVDVTLNSGGPSVYIHEGVRSYRLFWKARTEVTHGNYYVVEGVNAQKAIDEIGDPDQGKHGYPLLQSCQQVVWKAWPGLSFDEVDTRAAALRARIQRYPARPVFLVKRIISAGSTSPTDLKKVSAAQEKNIKEVEVDADKQKALLVEGVTTLPAPLWDPTGGTRRCKVVIGTDGKIDELATGAQLCEYADWSKFLYQPPVKAGQPVKVDTEVELTFEPRK